MLVLVFFVLVLSWSHCQHICGDGIIERPEVCDDGNSRSGDGCTFFCTIETDWTCATPHTTESYCMPKSCVSNGKCDFVFVLESSNEVSDEEWRYMMSFVLVASRYLTIAYPEYRIGVVTFADSAWVEETLTTDLDLLEEGLSTLKQRGHHGAHVRTDLGLFSAIFEVETWGHDSSCSVFFVVTHGASGKPDLTKQMAQKAHHIPTKTSQRVISIGIGDDVPEEEVLALASGREIALKLPSYSHLPLLVPRICSLLTGQLCTNGVVEAGEGCDDGNHKDGDGCDGFCKIEHGWTCVGISSVCTTQCGDGLVVPGVEQCDDGNTLILDGCSDTCSVERGYGCDSREPSRCNAVCGDGVVGYNVETCDDNNAVADDGCDDTCHVEPGYTCVEDPAKRYSVCTRDAKCGDGIFSSTREGCDDGNTKNNDGCAQNCQVEVGWSCSGVLTSTCSTVCGDGWITAPEQCDDANTRSFDGCTNCVLDVGYMCSPATPPRTANTPPQLSVCVSTTTRCDTATNKAQCDQKPSCAWNGSSCLDSPPNCNSATNKTSCDLMSSCTWNGTSCGDTPANWCTQANDKVACDRKSSCTWSGTSCVDTPCSSITTTQGCNDAKHCTWNSATTSCDNQSRCDSVTDKVQCDQRASCTWTSNSCTDTPVCSSLLTVRGCNTATHCTWDSASNSCINTRCDTATDKAQCDQKSSCSWTGTSCTDMPSCSTILTVQTCNTTTNCAWNSPANACQDQIRCDKATNKAECDQKLTCTWTGNSCMDSPVCSSLLTVQGCNTAKECSWNSPANACQVACSSILTVQTCTAEKNCEWNSPGNACQDTPCANVGTAQACNSAKDCRWSSPTNSCIHNNWCNQAQNQGECNQKVACTWIGIACVDTPACSSILTVLTCNAAANCAWNSATNACQPQSCSSVLTVQACNAAKDCAWNSPVNACQQTTPTAPSSTTPTTPLTPTTSPTTPTLPPKPDCGNGVLDVGEVCDRGAVSNKDCNVNCNTRNDPCLCTKPMEPPKSTNTTMTYSPPPISLSVEWSVKTQEITVTIKWSYQPQVVQFFSFEEPSAQQSTRFPDSFFQLSSNPWDVNLYNKYPKYSPFVDESYKSPNFSLCKLPDIYAQPNPQVWEQKVEECEFWRYFSCNLTNIDCWRPRPGFKLTYDTSSNTYTVHGTIHHCSINGVVPSGSKAILASLPISDTHYETNCAKYDVFYTLSSSSHQMSHLYVMKLLLSVYVNATDAKLYAKLVVPLYTDKNNKKIEIENCVISKSNIGLNVINTTHDSISWYILAHSIDIRNRYHLEVDVQCKLMLGATNTHHTIDLTRSASTFSSTVSGSLVTFLSNNQATTPDGSLLGIFGTHDIFKMNIPYHTTATLNLAETNIELTPPTLSAPQTASLGSTNTATIVLVRDGQLVAPAYLRCQMDHRTPKWEFTMSCELGNLPVPGKYLLKSVLKYNQPTTTPHKAIVLETNQEEEHLNIQLPDKQRVILEYPFQVTPPGSTNEDAEQSESNTITEMEGTETTTSPQHSNTPDGDDSPHTTATTLTVKVPSPWGNNLTLVSSSQQHAPEQAKRIIIVVFVIVGSSVVLLFCMVLLGCNCGVWMMRRKAEHKLPESVSVIYGESGDAVATTTNNKLQQSAIEDNIQPLGEDDELGI